MDEERWEQFAELRDSALQTARAWGYKEHAMTLWAYRSRAWARKAWLAWYRSAIRCRLEPVKRVARMIKRHLDGIVTAVVDKVTNARAESINAGIQKVKYSARGFRNRKRFRNAIYFHLGGLGYPYLQQGFASLLPLIESFGIATAAEVGVETLAQRLRQEAATSGRLIVLPPHVTAYARLPA